MFIPKHITSVFSVSLEIGLVKFFRFYIDYEIDRLFLAENNNEAKNNVNPEKYNDVNWKVNKLYKAVYVKHNCL